MLLAETIYCKYGETEAVMDVGNIMVTNVYIVWLVLRCTLDILQ